MPFRYRVFGRLVEAGSGRPLAALRVRAFDKDLVRDDPLGSSVSDANGRFDIQFTELDFRDVVEARPDLYFRVFDSEGREIHSTEDHPIWNAKGDEDVAIEIPRERLGG
jgi:hypothetical protein